MSQVILSSSNPKERALEAQADALRSSRSDLETRFQDLTNSSKTDLADPRVQKALKKLRDESIIRLNQVSKLDEKIKAYQYKQTKKHSKEDATDLYMNESALFYKIFTAIKNLPEPRKEPNKFMQNFRSLSFSLLNLFKAEAGISPHSKEPNSLKIDRDFFMGENPIFPLFAREV